MDPTHFVHAAFTDASQSKVFLSDEHSWYSCDVPRAINHLLIGTSVEYFLYAYCVAGAPVFIFPKQEEPFKYAW